MAEFQAGYALRIYLSEQDKHHGKPLYEWIVHQVRDQGLEYVKVVRGIMGFGALRRVHTIKIELLSLDLPIVVEVIDTEEQIDRFLGLINGAIPDGLITISKTQVRSS